MIHQNETSRWRQIMLYFDGNETARNNMTSAIISADVIGRTEEYWKLADNTVKLIQLAELKEALVLSIQEVGSIVTAGVR